MPTLKLKAKVQTIYFKTPANELGTEYATEDKRISLNEAAQILANRNIAYNELLKVQYEYITLTMPTADVTDYIKN